MAVRLTRSRASSVWSHGGWVSHKTPCPFLTKRPSSNFSRQSSSCFCRASFTTRFPKCSSGPHFTPQSYSYNSQSNSQMRQAMSSTQYKSTQTTSLKSRLPTGPLFPVRLREMSSLSTEDESEAYRKAMPYRKIPTAGVISSLPYIGARFLFKPFTKYPVEQFGHMINGLHEAHGPIYRLRISKVWQVHIDRVEDAEIAFRNEEEAPYRTPFLIEQVYNQRADSPVNFFGITNGPNWRRVRSSLNVLMNRPRSVTHYLTAQEQVAEDFADRLYREQGLSDPAAVTDLFFRFATESVGVVCFNKRLGFLDEDSETDAQKAKLLWSYRTYTRCVSEAMFGRRILYRLYEDSFYREYKEAKETIVEHARQCITEAREETTHREKEGTLDPDEANFLLSLVTEKSLTAQDVFDVVFSLMAGGSDTTSCSLQLLFYALATNPDKQEKVAEEVLTHMGPDGHLTAPVLDKLAYMTAAVREGMRETTASPFTADSAVLSAREERELLIVARRFFYVAGYTPVNVETRLILNSLGNATCPRYFDNPENFSPERWLRNKEGQRDKDIHPLAHLPFGVGRRNCIGRRFAIQELYLAATKTLQKYRIGLKEDCPPLETIFTPVRAPKHPLPFTLTPRH